MVFAQGEIAPHAEHLDKAEEPPTENFKKYVKADFYDGVIFHRVATWMLPTQIPISYKPAGSSQV
jgi:cyclophilin family peptidyl-prolyl cis-trans isomerase